MHDVSDPPSPPTTRFGSSCAVQSAAHYVEMLGASGQGQTFL